MNTHSLCLHSWCWLNVHHYQDHVIIEDEILYLWWTEKEGGVNGVWHLLSHHEQDTYCYTWHSVNGGHKTLLYISSHASPWMDHTKTAIIQNTSHLSKLLGCYFVIKGHRVWTGTCIYMLHLWFVVANIYTKNTSNISITGDVVVCIIFKGYHCFFDCSNNSEQCTLKY